MFIRSGSDVLYTSLGCDATVVRLCPAVWGSRWPGPWSSLRIYPSIVKSAAVAINSLLDTHKNCEPLWRTQIIPFWSNIPDHSHRLIIVTCLTFINASKWNGCVRKSFLNRYVTVKCHQLVELVSKLWQRHFAFYNELSTKSAMCNVYVVCVIV